MDAKIERKSGFAGLMALSGLSGRKILFSALLTITGYGLGAVPFILIYQIVVEVAERQPEEISHAFIWILIVSGIVAILLKNIFLALSTMVSHITAYNSLYDLRIRISKKLVSLPLGYFNEKTTGQIKKVMIEDVEQLEVFVAHNLPDFIGAAIYIFVTLCVLACFDWRLTLAVVCVLPMGIWAKSAAMDRSRGVIKKFYSAQEEMNATMIQYIQGMTAIKAFNQTSDTFQKYAKSVRACKYYEDLICEKWYLPMTLFHTGISANLLVLLPVGSMMYLCGTISMARFVLFLLMGLGFGTPLFQLSTFGSMMNKNFEGMARINAILDAPPLPEVSVESPVIGHGISGKDIEFGFNGKKVIKNVSFEVPEGKFIALVGPSGAGKTTLARLIPRFWDADSGAIYLGAADITRIRLRTLMDQLTFVFQNVFLFNGTVSDNLKMGCADATRAQMEKAARAARCHDFIMALPQGYETVIGERGARLSGGEKQRLSIARALLKKTPLVILDEATAFIDPENELVIQKAIDALTRDKTLIIIAHRLSTITCADEIFLIDKGRITARGNHDFLLASAPLYRELWNAHTAAKAWKL